MTDTRRSEIRELAAQYRHRGPLTDQLIGMIYELTAPEPPKAQPEESQESLQNELSKQIFLECQDNFSGCITDFQLAIIEIIRDSGFTLVRKPGKEEKG